MLKVSSRGSIYKKVVIAEAYAKQIFTNVKKTKFTRDLKIKICHFPIDLITLKYVLVADYMERNGPGPSGLVHGLTSFIANK